MIKQNFIIAAFICFSFLPVNSQVKNQDDGLKREVTLYNPYKPSLPDFKKRSYLPDMSDTIKVRTEFHYEVNANPFFPEYTVSPIKAVSLLPDPLTKLYKSYINIGIGNYLTPLAEISITNERSKIGTLGFYGRHFSTNGNVELQNGKKVFAGYMDNDASLFGKKFFRQSLLESSIDFTQKVRYAYGYDTSMTDYIPFKKDIRLNYNNIGAKASLASLNMDSASLSYKFNIDYNYFYNAKNLSQHNFGVSGLVAKSFNGLYIGSGLNYDTYKLSDSILSRPKYIVSISPFIRKSNELWNFNLGLQVLLERNMSDSAELHFYPDLNFGFNAVPKYICWFAGLSGKLETNDPLKIISENPFLLRDGSLFTLPNTDHSLIISTGLKGNTGIGGNYLVSASYSLINNMLFYSNLISPLGILRHEIGNYFVPLPDNVELLKIQGEINGIIGDKISYNGNVNFYKYTLTSNEYAWNKPGWESRLGLKYNLKDKIILGAELTGIGKRKLSVVDLDISRSPVLNQVIDTPVHFNLNLSAEYRYSKILSLWAKFYNLSNNPYFEWAYYPSQRFNCMLGFTYSL